MLIKLMHQNEGPLIMCERYFICWWLEFTTCKVVRIAKLYYCKVEICKVVTMESAPLSWYATKLENLDKLDSVAPQTLNGCKKDS